MTLLLIALGIVALVTYAVVGALVVLIFRSVAIFPYKREQPHDFDTATAPTASVIVLWILWLPVVVVGAVVLLLVGIAHGIMEVVRIVARLFRKVAGPAPARPTK